MHTPPGGAQLGATTGRIPNLPLPAKQKLHLDLVLLQTLLRLGAFRVSNSVTKALNVPINNPNNLLTYVYFYFLFL